MNQAVESLLGYLKDNWPELLWIVAAAGLASYIAGRRARTRWRKGEFLNRLNVTLTTIQDGVLRIRTILEMDCEAIFLNPSAAKSVVNYARQTTETDPLLPIPEPDCWQFLNAVLNEISERFADGQIKRDLGEDVVQGRYLLCLTCERAGPVRTQKIRAMMVRRSLLENLPDDEPKYESETHCTRWQTLQTLSEQLEQHPYRFIEIEICL